MNIGSSRLNNEDPTHRHLGGVSYTANQTCQSSREPITPRRLSEDVYERGNGDVWTTLKTTHINGDPWKVSTSALTYSYAKAFKHSGRTGTGFQEYHCQKPLILVEVRYQGINWVQTECSVLSFSIPRECCRSIAIIQGVTYFQIRCINFMG
jgi:hypothetical protein